MAETYPAECYSWFPGEPLRSKTDIECRKRFGNNLLAWATEAQVEIEASLKKAIDDGFSVGEDDAFDSVVGLFGMLQIALGQRTTGEPDDKVIREIEGWILGRGGSNIVTDVQSYTAATDPELRDWLRWASESGESSSFIRAIAEAASIADLADYALLRPALLNLKRRGCYAEGRFESIQP
jgi:hypothetical protein